MAAYQDRDFNPGPFCPGKVGTIKDDEIEQFVIRVAYYIFLTKNQYNGLRLN